MTNDEGNLNDEARRNLGAHARIALELLSLPCASSSSLFRMMTCARGRAFEVGSSGFVILSSFVIRASSFPSSFFALIRGLLNE